MLGLRFDRDDLVSPLDDTRSCHVRCRRHYRCQLWRNRRDLSLRPLRLFPKDAFEQKLLARTSLLQYVTFQFFAVSVLLAMPVKLILRLALTIKYVWVTPWFNI